MTRQMPLDLPLVMDSVRFFCWIIGSILTLAVTLLGIYLRMYVRDALHDHSNAIYAMIATNYVRRDVHDEQVRNLRSLIEGNTA